MTLVRNKGWKLKDFCKIFNKLLLHIRWNLCIGIQFFIIEINHAYIWVVIVAILAYFPKNTKYVIVTYPKSKFKRRRNRQWLYWMVMIYFIILIFSEIFLTIIQRKRIQLLHRRLEPSVKRRIGHFSWNWPLLVSIFELH